MSTKKNDAKETTQTSMENERPCVTLMSLASLFPTKKIRWEVYCHFIYMAVDLWIAGVDDCDKLFFRLQNTANTKMIATNKKTPSIGIIWI